MKHTAMGLVGLCLLAASSARGAELQDSLLAETLFREGQEQMKAGNVEQACAKFAASYKIDPAGGTLLNLANCQEKAGKLATAWIAYTESAALAAKGGNKDREAFAKGKADALQPKLNMLRFQVAKPILGQELKLDGKVIPWELWGTATPTDPGEHQVEVTAPDRVAFKQKLTLGPANLANTVEVPELAEVAGKAAPVEEPVVEAKPAAGSKPEGPMIALPADAKPVMSGGRIGGITVAAVGAAGVGVGIGLLASATGLASERDALCPPGTGACYSQAAFDKDHEARVQQQWGFVAGAVGIVAAGMGALLAVWSPDVIPEEQHPAPAKDESKDSGPDVSWNVGPTSNGMQIVIGGTW